MSGMFLAGCSYVGSARAVEPPDLEGQPGWVMVRDLPVLRQEHKNDCGPAVLSMVLTYWKVPATDLPAATDRGLKAGEMRDYVRSKGLDAFLICGNLEDLKHELGLGRPVIVGLRKPYVTGLLNHYEVVIGINPDRREIVTVDPARGWQKNSFDGFLQEWEPSERLTLVIFKNAEGG